MSFIYHFFPATPNIGNNLIGLALQELLSEVRVRPFSLINMPAKGISGVIKQGGISRQTVNDINELGSGVLIGPGNLFENNGLEVDLTALEALRVPPLIFSVSWGRIYDDKGRLYPRTDSMPNQTIRALCQKSAAVLVRDESTRSHLESLGIERVKVIGCPVLAFSPKKLSLPAEDSRTLGAAIISLRNPILMNISPRLQGRVHRDVRRLIDGLKEMGHSKVVLLCHDLRDLRFASAYDDTEKLYTENTLQYLGWLRDAKICVTFRLHSFLPCAVLGTPAVHFTYDERAASLIETAALQNCDVNYVQHADPVKQALMLCADPNTLLSMAAQAAPRWSDLRQTIQTELSHWIKTTEVFQ